MGEAFKYQSSWKTEDLSNIFDLLYAPISEPLAWLKATAQTGLTGDKTGTFNLTTTGKGTFGTGSQVILGGGTYGIDIADSGLRLNNSFLYLGNSSLDPYLYRSVGTIYLVNTTLLNMDATNLTTTGTLGAGVTTLAGNNGNAAFTLLNLNNNVTPLTTETAQTADLVFNLTQSINSVVSLHEAAKISAYKVSDWFHASAETDTDSGLKFWTTKDGTPTLQLTIDEAGLATFVGGITAPYINITTEAAGYQVDGIRALSIKGSTGSANVLLGQSGNFTMTGTNNIFAGYQAGLANVGGVQNIFIGYQAGYSTKGDGAEDAGSYNVFIGAYAGQANIGSGEADAQYNVFIGTNAGVRNTTGFSNMFLAAQAGYYNTSGTYNSFIGESAGYSNTTGGNNLFMGNSSGWTNQTGNYNTYLGPNAGFYATGSNNVMLGYFAGSYETGSNSFYVDNQDRTNTAGDKAKTLIYGVFASTAASQTIKFNAATTVNGNATLGGASTNTITHTGRMIVRTTASDPQHATPGSRPAGTVAEIAYYNGKMYFCTSSSVPTWEKFTSL